MMLDVFYTTRISQRKFSCTHFWTKLLSPLSFPQQGSESLFLSFLSSSIRPVNREQVMLRSVPKERKRRERKLWKKRRKPEKGTRMNDGWPGRIMDDHSYCQCFPVIMTNYSTLRSSSTTLYMKTTGKLIIFLLCCGWWWWWSLLLSATFMTKVYSRNMKWKQQHA